MKAYRKAGCIEVVRDVVKDELGGGVLPCAAFGANAAWFRLYLLTSNLLSAMKVLALPPPLEDARPKRLRFAVFNLPARLVSHARRLLARVARSLLERADLLLGRARATAHRLGSLNAQIVLPSGPCGRPTSVVCQPTASHSSTGTSKVSGHGHGDDHDHPSLP